MVPRETGALFVYREISLREGKAVSLEVAWLDSAVQAADRWRCAKKKSSIICQP
ncbi:hypothetical protein GGTG_14380, partial [Gaeumannomyces tritici R3-111a-1]